MIGQIDRQTLQLFSCVSQQVPLIMQTGFVWEMLNCNSVLHVNGLFMCFVQETQNCSFLLSVKVLPMMCFVLERQNHSFV